MLESITDNQWTKLRTGAQMGLRMMFNYLSTTKGELKYTRLLQDLCALRIKVGLPGTGVRVSFISRQAFVSEEY